MGNRSPQVGDRVRLVEYGEPYPLEELNVGAEGTIVALTETGEFSTLVDWDGLGRTEWHNSHELKYIGGE